MARLVASRVCRTRRIVPASSIALIRSTTTSRSTPACRAISPNGSGWKPCSLSSLTDKIAAFVGSAVSTGGAWVASSVAGIAGTIRWRAIMQNRPTFLTFLIACVVAPMVAALTLAGVALAAEAVFGERQASAADQASGGGGPATTSTSNPASQPTSQAAADVELSPVDHAPFTALLQEHVDADGFVNYDALAGDRPKLDAYLDDLAAADLKAMNVDERLATLINAYNAMMLALVLDERPLEHIVDDIEQPFDKKRFVLAGESVSLDDIEHGMIRADFDEPRIHWAVVCGAFSCPPLRNEAYTGETLDKQLAGQAEYVHTHPRYIEYDGGDTIRLTRLYDWYAGDFMNGDVLDYLKQYRPDVEGEPEIEFIEYLWLPNDVSNRDQLPKE